MASQLFVVSDPPHGTVDQDEVAALLGIDIDVLRLKIGFPAPEVLAANDPEPALAVAERLERTGMSVKALDGASLAGVPWPALVSSCYFDESALTARVGDEAIVVPYEAPIAVVSFTPPADFDGPGAEAIPAVRAAGAGRALAEAIQFLPGTDVYVPRPGGLRRITFVGGVTDFGGLPSQPGSATAEVLEATVAELARRYPHAAVDTRLENVRPRRKFAMGDESFDLDMRKLFSYGTLLLRQALMAVDPELGDLPQYELGSRVAWALSRSDGAR